MPERYRIAIVTRTFPPRSGGIASAHYNLFKLLESQHDVRAFAFDDDNSSPSRDVVRRKSSPALNRLATWLASRYVRHYDKSAPAVYFRGIASVAHASWSLTRPLRQFDPDIVIVPDNFVPALALGMPKNASVIWMSHNNYKRFEVQPLVHKRSWMDVHMAHRMELRALRKAHFVICPSLYMKRVFEETYPVQLPIEVIYNFVHKSTLDKVEPADLAGKLHVDKEYRFIYLPSAGMAMKGKRYAFEIIRRLGAGRKVGFFISGPVDADLRRELKELEGSIPVYAPGHLAYSENLSHAAACDFAISPTLIENLSNAIVEGLMLGLPFVTFDTGGNREIVLSGTNGFVVPYLDVEAMIERATQLLGDFELLLRQRSLARAPLEALLDEDAVRNRYNSIFERLRAAANFRSAR